MTKRDEPQGRFIARQRGRAVTAKKFHLYRDCGMFWGGTGTGATEDFETIDVEDRDIDLLKLTVCSSCDRRSKEVSALDCIADAIEGRMVSDGTCEITVDGQDAFDLAETIVNSLTHQGYDIVRRRKP